MPAASEAGGVVTNGMSNYARDGVNANSALVVQVTGADFFGRFPVGGRRVSAPAGTSGLCGRRGDL